MARSIREHWACLCVLEGHHLNSFCLCRIQFAGGAGGKQLLLSSSIPAWFLHKLLQKPTVWQHSSFFPVKLVRQKLCQRGLSCCGIVLIGNKVQKRFESLKKRKDPSTFSEQDLDERILKQQQEEEERKRQRKEKKEKKKEQTTQHEPEDIDPDVAAMMGFGGFGSSKK